MERAKPKPQTRTPKTPRKKVKDNQEKTTLGEKNGAEAVSTDEALPQQDEIEIPEQMTEETQQGKTYEDFHDFGQEDFDDAPDEELTYSPPEKNKVLPDLNKLIESLEDGTTDPEEEPDTPSLFARPEHVPNYQKISELRIQLEEEEIKQYIYEFDSNVQDDVLMVGNISLEEIQEEERRLRDEHIAYQEQEAAVARQRQQNIAVEEEETKRRLARDLKEKKQIIQRRMELLRLRERLLIDRVHKTFRRAENQLVSTLERRKGEVKTMYGDLVVSDGIYGSSKGRRWRVDWERTPQPVQIKLKTIRGVKDKLPEGRYILMVTLYDRLGGQVMRWSQLRGQRWGGTTLPVHHDGHFYNTEIKLDQSVFTVLPSKPDVRPGMVLLFELFLLRGATVPTDRVVGWGCFPIADGTFNVVEGRFKVPFLRGEADNRITKHSMIEELMSSEVDHWLCNLYFEVVKLPRYLQGQKEYEVELQFSSGLINFPDRIDTGEENRDGESPLAGSDPDFNTDEPLEGNVEEDRIYALDALASGSNSSPGNLTIGSSNNGSEISTKKPGLPVDASENKKLAILNESSLGSMYDLQRPPSAALSITKGNQRPCSAVTSMSLQSNKKLKLDGDFDSDEYEEEEILYEKKEGFFPVKDHPGVFYKKYRTNNVDEYHKKIYALIPKTPVPKTKRRKRLSYLDELETHTFSVNDDSSDKGRPSSANSTKMEYVMRQLFAELGLSQWRSREFWAMVVLFVLCFFMRMYLHYVSQWLFLQGASIPVNRFDFSAYTVFLNYQPSLLTVAEETLVVLLGVFGNILVFALFVFLCWIVQKIFGYFPSVGCKFVLLLGVNAFLDPFFIAIADTALQRWNDVGGDSPIADYVKIYWNYDRTQGSGLAGIFITVFLYFFTCFASGAVLYMYFLRLHNNGRMLDIYWRLFGEEDLFFVPFDLEISNQELAYLVNKAEQWRGEEGERRKIAVYDYIWEEDEDDLLSQENEEVRSKVKSRKYEVTTHVSIHTLHLDGLKELYRHFLRMPDGAIVEVFGDMTMPGVDKDISNAVVARAKTPDDNSASLESLNQVRQRNVEHTEVEMEEEKALNILPASPDAKLKDT